MLQDRGLEGSNVYQLRILSKLLELKVVVLASHFTAIPIRSSRAFVQ